MTVGIIIMARMGSSRLPGKVLKTAAGVPLLDLLVHRLRRVSNADTVVLATSVEARDDVVAERGSALGIPVFRGSENDTMDRFLSAIRAFDLSYIIRVTGDCPMIDPATVGEVVQLLTRERFDYVSTDLTLQYPNGMGCEGYTRRTIERMHAASRGMDTDQSWMLARDPAMNFRRGQIAASPLGDLSSYRLTVDTQEDFDLVSRIIETLAPKNYAFTLDDIVALLRENPEWVRINAHVAQKTGPHRRIA
jgi:spore coat polysaccharide biosynthesis protein SpsF